MTFETSTDYALVRSILTEPLCYSRMIDDRAPNREDFECGPVPGVEYLIARCGVQPAGVFLLDRDEVHFCILPSCWGHTEEIARAFLAWVWHTTGRQKLIGRLPAHNRLALRLARKVGFVEVDRSPRAIRKRGKVYDVLLMEMERPREFQTGESPQPRTF